MDILNGLNADNSIQWKETKDWDSDYEHDTALEYDTGNDVVKIKENVNSQLPDDMKYELTFTVWSENLNELLARAAVILNGNSDALHIITDKNDKVTIVKT